MKKVSEVKGCEGCPLRRLFPDNTFVSPQVGSSTRLIVGEAPGSEEAKAGEPFVGGAGRILDALLPKAGVDRKQVSVINCIQCQPQGNVFPTDSDARSYISEDDAHAAVKQCLTNHVEPFLRGRKWSRIDLLGEKALRYVGGKGGGIFKWRGSPIPVPDIDSEQLLAIPTLHPAYIMRDQSMLPVFANDLRKGLTPPEEHYLLYPSVDDVKAFTAKEFAFDIETDWKGGAGHGNITMVGLSDKATNAIVVPFQGQYIDELKRIFLGASSVIGHNCIQFDLPILRQAGISVSDTCELWDTMLMQHLRFPDLPHDLEFVGSQFCNKPAWKADKDIFERYCARDVDVTKVIYDILKPMLVAYGLMDLYKQVQVPLAKICYLMHETGFTVDPTHIESVREKLTAEMLVEEQHLPEELRTRTKKVNKRIKAPEGYCSPRTGKPVKYMAVEAEESETPWRSGTVVGKYLYKTLGLDEQFDLKTGEVTTGKMALERIWRKTGNRAVLAIQKLRKMNSLMTLFAKKEMLTIEKMYPHFNVHGTSSGRLSSSDPNLQNVPDKVRFIYVPSKPGYKIIDVDYSQIENRLTAYFARDTERMQRFLDDANFSEHKFAASQFFDIPYDEVLKDNDKDAPYGKAKRIVHGTNYGMGAKKISLMYDMEFKETKRLQNIWKNAIKKTSDWQAETAALAKKQGYLVTPFSRKRWFYTSSYFTESLSFLPQSTAADVIFRAMLGLMYERINWPLAEVQKVVKVVKPLPIGCSLLLQVHDSLIFECPAELVDEVVATVKEVMEQPWKELGGLKIPIGVKVGDSWGEAE